MKKSLQLRKRTILVLSEEQTSEAVGAGSNISCDGGDCHGNGTGNATDCWETCNTCHESCYGTCDERQSCARTCHQTFGCGCQVGGGGSDDGQCCPTDTCCDC